MTKGSHFGSDSNNYLIIFLLMFFGVVNAAVVIVVETLVCELQNVTGYLLVF